MLRQTYRLLLVVALLLTQLGSLTHGISHALFEQQQTPEQSLPHEKHCGLCAAYAQIGNAINSNSFSLLSAVGIDTPVAVHDSVARSTVFAAFAARAPPYSA